jgi:hypothetical protein
MSSYSFAGVTFTLAHNMSPGCALYKESIVVSLACFTWGLHTNIPVLQMCARLPKTHTSGMRVQLYQPDVVMLTLAMQEKLERRRVDTDPEDMFGSSKMDV